VSRVGVYQRKVWESGQGRKKKGGKKPLSKYTENLRGNQYTSQGGEEGARDCIRKAIARGSTGRKKE